jgi:penicillin amidase
MYQAYKDRVFSGRSVFISLTTLAVIIFAAFTFILSVIEERSEILTIESQYTKSNIEIYKSQEGIPHIITQNEDDLLFAMGYMHAKDRLWQMELNLRIAEGRLSELFGEEYLSVDIFMRSLDLTELSKEIYNLESTTGQKNLKNYTKGINFYLDNIDELPLEYGLLNIPIREWQPHYSILIQRLWALKTSTAFWIEPVLSSIAAKIGTENLYDLLSTNSNDIPLIFEKDQNVEDDFFIQEETDSLELSDFTANITDKLNISPNTTGCNVWVTHSKASDSSSSLVLANDYHSELELPAQWYQWHYTSSKTNVVGLSIPGIPFSPAGRNDEIAWGISAMNIDDCDFKYFSIDSTGNRYLDSTDKWKRIQFVVDTIKISNKQPYPYFKKYIKGQAILSGNIFQYRAISKKSNQRAFYKKYAVQPEWTGNIKSSEIEVLHNISKAYNPQQFEGYIANWQVPALVFAYADKKNNFDLFGVGGLPVRNANTNPLILNKYEYENPTLFENIMPLNYKSSVDSNFFVFAANNQLFINDTVYISKYWDNPYRSKRISQNLFNSYVYTPADAQVMQNDIYSTYAKELLDICIPVWEEHINKLTPIQKEALTMLKKWDYIFSIDSYEATIFSTFLDRLLFNVFSDELGNNLYNKYSNFKNINEHKLLSLIKNNGNSRWFDNTNTQSQENAYFYIFKTFMEATTLLEKQFSSSDIQDWQYGLLNKVYPKHFFMTNDLFENNTEKSISVGGSSTTITNLFKSKGSISGASMRFISDLNDSLVYTIIPGGSSGNSMSVNYTNQFDLWANSAYVNIPVSRQVNSNLYKKSIVITPAK